MNQDRITYGELIYSRAGEVQVYRGTFTNPGERPIQVAIKILYFTSIEKANFIYKEVFSMMRFKDTPNVSKVYLCEISQDSNLGYFIRIVMEFYSKGDLKKLITSRSLSSTRFSNEELIFHFRTLIKVFAEFQLKRVAHRDIKPENIFIGDDGELVVGDLGCADEVKANSSTIAGTPLYLSPEVREAYIERMSVGKSTKRYDVFISDVYSLGLTFIYMATLQEFTKVATSPLSAIDSLVQEKIAEVSHSYPQIAEQLRKMLKFKAEDRTSFIEIAFQIGIPLSISENFCKICEKKFKCMKLVCNTCYNQVLNLLEFHENSQFRFQLNSYSTDFCKICKKFHEYFISCSSAQASSQSLQIFCNSCNFQIIPRLKLLFCESCKIYSCLICNTTDEAPHYLCTLLWSNPRSSMFQIPFTPASRSSVQV